MIDKPTARGTGSRHLARIVLAGVLVAAALWVTRGVFIALAWGVLIAIAVWPLYRRLRDALATKTSTAAALIVALGVGVVLLSLGTLILIELGRDAPVLLGWVQQAQQNGIPVPSLIARLPILGTYAENWWRLHLSNPAALSNLFGGANEEKLTAWTRSYGGQLLHGLFLTGLTLLSVFFLLHDGEWATEHLLVLANGWLGSPGERLAEKLAQAVRDTVNATLVIAVGEGVLIGASYVVAGVPQAVLFGVLTALFALVPFGAWVVFSAASLTLLATGSGILAPLGVFVFGAVVMLIGDNIVQPALIGGAARLPFLWALFGIIGGLESLGLIGLFIGPVLMAALLTIWREWGDVAPSTRSPGSDPSMPHRRPESGALGWGWDGRPPERDGR